MARRIDYFELVLNLTGEKERKEERKREGKTKEKGGKSKRKRKGENKGKRSKTRKKRKECAGNADAAKICMRIHKLFFYLRTKL